MIINISDQKREEIVSRLQQDIDAANSYYESEIEPAVRERYAIYNADESYYARMFPTLSQRSSLVSTDVQDTIESTMPSLMKTFFGSTDVISISGQDGTEQDAAKAEKMQALINFELERAKFYKTSYQWFKDALVTNLGILKVDWQRTTKPEQKQMSVPPDVYDQIRAAISQQKDLKVKSAKLNKITGMYDVVFEASVLNKNQPRLMNLLASEFRYSPDATNLDDADFTAHRKIVSLDYLRGQEEAGVYSNVAELTERATDPHYTVLDTDNNDYIDRVSNDTDSGRRKVELYECYVNINMSDDPDARLTPMIITVSNGVILRAEENTYERNPFFVISPRLDPHKIWPENGFVDLIAPLQHAKTAALRQMLYNMAQSNDSKYGIDMAKLYDIDDLLSGAQYIRINGSINDAIQPLPAAPLQNWTMNMLEYLDAARENRTGITKYNQGMDNNSLNKTATGVNIITQQANQRLELIARMFAETGMSDLFRFLIKLNQLFISEDTVVRLTNGTMQISPDDLDGDFDLVVNAGMGAGAKQQNLQNLQALQGVMTQLAQMGTGLVGPIQAYNFAKKYIEEVGYKDVDSFLMSPQQAQQMQMQMAQQQSQQPEIEKLNLDDEGIPWQVKMQYFQRQGYQVDPSWFTENVVQGQLSNAIKENMKANGGTIDGTAIAAARQNNRVAQTYAAGQNSRGYPAGSAAVPQQVKNTNYNRA